MSVFRRSSKVPGARQGGSRKGGDSAAAVLPDLVDLADLTDPEAVDAVLRELDDLRATVYRQENQLREGEARLAALCAAARVEEHRRVLVAVAAMSELAKAGPAATPEIAAFAARIQAAVERVRPVG